MHIFHLHSSVTLSEPAKSTKWNLLVSDFTPSSPSPSRRCCFSTTENIACERDETAFMSVDAVVRHSEPFARNLYVTNFVNIWAQHKPKLKMNFFRILYPRSSSGFSQRSSRTPLQYMLPAISSRIAISVDATELPLLLRFWAVQGLSRSTSSSL